MEQHRKDSDNSQRAENGKLNIDIKLLLVVSQTCSDMCYVLHNNRFSHFSNLLGKQNTGVQYIISLFQCTRYDRRPNHFFSKWQVLVTRSKTKVIPRTNILQFQFLRIRRSANSKYFRNADHWTRLFNFEMSGREISNCKLQSIS